MVLITAVAAPAIASDVPSRSIQTADHDHIGGCIAKPPATAKIKLMSPNKGGAVLRKGNAANPIPPSKSGIPQWKFLSAVLLECHALTNIATLEQKYGRHVSADARAAPL
mmetsp:Transcript_49395/g.117539  ORF Transcript_49395/g.117539 Transcript_49395/m.117539 type:complete len:110 (-) Transcript_49395:393-722(-)